nr:hypothetical protein [Tanacetum cinerariifolium]
MAGEGPANMIARRVTDDVIYFSGENAPPKFMKFFLVQKVAESRSGENAPPKFMKFFLVQKVAESRRFAMEDQEKVHNSLLAAKDAKRSEEGKVLALNEVIVDALDEIETQQNNVKILDGTGDDIDLCLDVAHPLRVVFGDIIIWRLFTIVDWCSHLVYHMLYYAGSVEGCSIARLQYVLSFLYLCVGLVVSVIYGPFFILDKLGEVAESPSLPDKMKVVFDQARMEEASFAALMGDLCCSLLVSLSKKRET